VKSFVLICLITFSFWDASSQDFGSNSGVKGLDKMKKDQRYLSVGGGIHFTQYFGDLNPFAFSNLFRVRSSDVGLTANLEYRRGRNVSFYTGLSWIRLTADDYYTFDSSDPDEIANYTRNLSFRNDMLEFTFQARYYFVKNKFSYVERPVFSPYLFGGIGVLYHGPKARIPEFKPSSERYENFGRWQPLRELGTEGQFSSFYDIEPYSTIQPVIPVGLGFSYKLNNTLNIIFEVSYRYLFTDYIDDVSGNYVDLGSLDSDLAKSLSDRSGEINSSNGRNPRNFSNILAFTDPINYTSKYDNQIYEVLDGYGNEGNKRGDDKSSDFYLLTSFKISYILAGKNEK